MKFRAEIDVTDSPAYFDRELYLDFDLYYADMNALGGANEWKKYAKNIDELA